MSSPRYKLEPFPHQAEGVAWLSTRVDPVVGRVIPGVGLLGDGMRMGKTKQVVDAAELLFERGEVDRVIVVTLNSAKSVWFDGDWGEVRINLWDGMPTFVTSLHNSARHWQSDLEGPKALRWVVTNYDFIRPLAGYSRMKADERALVKDVLVKLLGVCTSKTVLVIDESSAVANPKSQQSKACWELRRRCGWVWLLNGTPVDHDPDSLYNQAEMMNPAILDCSNYYHFLNRYAIREEHVDKRTGRKFKVVTGWKNIDDLQHRLAPYVLRRESKWTRQKLAPQVLKVTLTEKTWRVYKELRDEFCVAVEDGAISTAAQAGVRAMRLAQVTSGYLAGLRKVQECCAEQDCPRCEGLGYVEESEEPRQVGTEKLDVTREWLKDQLFMEPNLKVIVWCRFRLELAAVHEMAKGLGMRSERLWGGQTDEERTAALALLRPQTAQPGPALLAGIGSTGAMGLNMQAAWNVLYASNDRRLLTRLQGEDRPLGPQQRRSVWYGDLIAEGPKGQKTVDHVIVSQLRAHRELADMTCSAWVTALKEE